MNVLVTGFAGTVGRAFTEFFLNRGDIVVGVDNSEWAVAAFPEHPNLWKHLADFCAIKAKKHTFDLIVHTAAFKHIDLGEANRESFHANNVLKTEALYKQVKAPILFISTDKAVYPSSFYGQSKQQGEVLTHKYGGVVARMGNVMASSGSVIPIWEQAIAEERPLPITDPTMKRYMQPAEVLVKRIMSLYEEAHPGDTIIPEMGEPKTVMELAKEVLKAKGIEDYAPGVTFIGRRPGEKQEEELMWDYESVVFENNQGQIVRRML